MICTVLPSPPTHKESLRAPTVQDFLIVREAILHGMNLLSRIPQ